MAVGCAICVIPPLSTLASTDCVGTPFVQKVESNQFSATDGVPCQTVCAYSADDPREKKLSVIAIGQQLHHREPTKNRFENVTVGLCSKFSRDIATVAFAIPHLNPNFVYCAELHH